MDSMGKIASIFLIVIMMFFVPMGIQAEKEEMMIESYVLAKSAYFVEHIRSNGAISREMYEQYQKQLAQTGFVYDIHMEHKQMVTNTEGEQEQEEEEKGLFCYRSAFYENDILETLFDKNEVYTMKQGDFFFLSVTSKTKGLSDKIKSYFLIPTDSSPAVHVSMGGRIRDETH